MEQTMLFPVAAGAAIAAVGVWWWLARRSARRVRSEAESRANEIVRQAERDADSKLREADVAAKEKLLQARTEFEKVSRKRRGELEAQESRIAQREDKLDRREEEARQARKMSRGESAHVGQDGACGWRAPEEPTRRRRSARPLEQYSG